LGSHRAVEPLGKLHPHRHRTSVGTSNSLILGNSLISIHFLLLRRPNRPRQAELWSGLGPVASENNLPDPYYLFAKGTECTYIPNHGRL
jgi:hypothetical protein